MSFLVIVRFWRYSSESHWQQTRAQMRPRVNSNLPSSDPDEDLTEKR